MKYRQSLVAAALAFAATSALAGSFVELPTTAPLRKFGTQNLLTDPLFINPGPVTGTNDDGISSYAPPPYLTLLNSRVTEVLMPVDVGGPVEEVGTFYDAVYRDTSNPNTPALVFATRLVLDPGDAEVNDIFRSGFTGYSTAVAWTFENDANLRLYSAARTAQGLLQGVDVFNADVVDMRSDINFSEGNPETGWYYIKTNAPYFALAEDVIRLRQAGEEGQPVVQAIFSGFVPSPVPEPSQYLMLLTGLMVVGFIAKRRMS